MSSTKISKMTTTTIQSQLHIKMKDFERHCSATVSESLWTEPSADCIIWAKNRKFVCHRLVLSMASDFLAKMLAEVSVPGFVPELMIPDIRPQVLELVISLMYTGEVCVPQHLRDQFVELCGLLQLKNADDFVEEGIGGQYDPFCSTVEKIAVDEVYAEEDLNVSVQMDNTSYGEVDEEDYDEEENRSLAFDSPVKRRVKREELQSSSRFDSSQKTIHVSEPDYNDPHMNKKAFVRVSRDRAQCLYERLEQLYKRVYMNLAVGAGDLSKEEFRVELVMQDDLLITGKITCIFCGKKIGIVFIRKADGTFRQWVAAMMKTHLKRKHSDLMVPSIAGEAT